MEVGPWQGRVGREEERAPYDEGSLEPTTQPGSSTVRSFLDFNSHLVFTFNAYLCVSFDLQDSKTWAPIPVLLLTRHGSFHF